MTNDEFIEELNCINKILYAKDLLYIIDANGSRFCLGNDILWSLEFNPDIEKMNELIFPDNVGILCEKSLIPRSSERYEYEVIETKFLVCESRDNMIESIYDTLSKYILDEN